MSNRIILARITDCRSPIRVGHSPYNTEAQPFAGLRPVFLYLMITRTYFGISIATYRTVLSLPFTLSITASPGFSFLIADWNCEGLSIF
jgi:hypothetical protein